MWMLSCSKYHTFFKQSIFFLSLRKGKIRGSPLQCFARSFIYNKFSKHITRNKQGCFAHLYNTEQCYHIVLKKLCDQNKIRETVLIKTKIFSLFAITNKKYSFKRKEFRNWGKVYLRTVMIWNNCIHIKRLLKKKCGECALSEETNQNHKLKNATTLNFVSDVREQPTSK